MQSGYRRLRGDQQATKQQQNTFTDLARHMKEMIIEDQREMQGSQMSSGRYKRPLFMVNDMESTFLTMDKSLLYVGDNSTFQKRITWILAIQWISFSFMVNSMAYFFRSPNFACRVPLTDIFYACSQTSACRLHPKDFQIINSQSSVSIVEEFGLYCGLSELIYQTEMLFFIGGFFSGFILSYIAERIGRRSVILIVLFFSIASMAACALVQSFSAFVICYFFAGFCLFGYETTVYIYISEISAMRFKTISINMLTMVWAGTPMFLVFLRYLPSWRYCFLLFAVIWLATLPFAYFCFLESPRFLLSKKCYSQVREIFQKISITNKRPAYKFKLIEEVEVENEDFLRLKGEGSEQQEDSVVGDAAWTGVKQYNYLDLFRYGSVKKATFFLMYVWLFRFFMYFSINLALQSVLQSGAILTLAISISSFFEVVGTFGILILTFIFKKKYTLLQMIKGCTLVLAILCGGLWLIEVNNECKVFEEYSGFCPEVVLMILLVSLIKFTNSILFSALIPYSSEAYPTVVRSMGYAFSLAIGRMSTFVVPLYINYTRANFQNKNAICFLAPFALLAFLFSHLMPSEGPMRDNIPEQEEQMRANRENREIELNIMRNFMTSKAQAPHAPSQSLKQ